MKVYNKLVRDKIPEIIEADGKVCRTHILSNEEYIVALEAKLNEEVAEYQADKNLEEMADVLEVLHAICVARGYSLDELELISLFPLKDIRICAGVQIQTGLVFFYSALPHFYKTLTYTTLQRMDFPDRIRVIIDLDK